VPPLIPSAVVCDYVAARLTSWLLGIGHCPGGSNYQCCRNFPG
jgi:hypothetical protein